jgi:hypothetical protein
MQVGHFGIRLNDLGKLREILPWIRLLTTAGRNNFRLAKFLINFLSNVDRSGYGQKIHPRPRKADHWAVISEVDFLVPDFLQTPRARGIPVTKRQKDGYDLVTWTDPLKWNNKRLQHSSRKGFGSGQKTSREVSGSVPPNGCGADEELRQCECVGTGVGD